MELTWSIVSIAGAVTLGAMSPGPSFIMVARTAVASSRADGFGAALGMGVGAMVFATGALLGLHVLLSAVPALYVALRIAGGMYLLILAFRLWRGASRPMTWAVSAEHRTGTLFRSFALGLLTQVSNPKTAVVYASIFMSLLPGSLSAEMLALLPLMIFAIETAWYSTVALVLSVPASRGAYVRWKTHVDRCAAGVMASLGVKLIATRAV
jgi:threonine/homoserine/homoserine lactone efflux protein